MIKQCWITLVGLFLIFGTLCGAQDVNFSEEVKADLIQKATTFQNTMVTYFASPEGRVEFEARNNLRQAYLTCDASYEVIIASAANYGDEVMRKVNEWQHKVELGLLHSARPSVTIEQFDVLAANYHEAYQKSSETSCFVEYQAAHKEFKADVVDLLKKGIQPKAIVEVLRDAGIHNERVLSRPAYWAAKE